MPEPKPSKRFWQIPLSYAAVTAMDNSSETPTETSKATVSSVTSADLDNLFKKMKTYITGKEDPPGINIEELETKMTQSSREVQEVRDQLSHTVSSLTARVDTLSEEIKIQNANLSDEIQRQNVLILGMQRQFQDCMKDFSGKLQDLYNKSHTDTISITPSASTSETGHLGDSGK